MFFSFPSQGTTTLAHLIIRLGAKSLVKILKVHASASCSLAHLGVQHAVVLAKGGLETTTTSSQRREGRVYRYDRRLG